MVSPSSLITIIFSTDNKNNTNKRNKQVSRDRNLKNHTYVVKKDLKWICYKAQAGRGGVMQDTRLGKIDTINNIAISIRVRESLSPRGNDLRNPLSRAQ
jgi:hypothetical protein